MFSSSGNPIERRKIPNLRYPSGFGYVVIPSNVDRNKYVENCFRTNLIDLLTEDSEFIQDVWADRWVLQRIEFPEAYGKIGSMVVFVNDAISNRPTAVGVVAKNDEYDGVKEHQFKLRKASPSAEVSITGQGDEGKLFINILSESGKEGGIFIDIKNVEKTGVFNVEVQGDIRLKSDKSTYFYSEEDVSAKAKKAISLDSTEKTNMIASKFSIQNKDNYSVKQLFDDIITQISAITVQTALGQMPILNKVQVEDLKNSVAKIFE
jgi:hypothetical protein